MRKISTGILGLILAVSSTLSLKADSIFNFENAPLGTSTNFSSTTADGVYTASFNAPVAGSFFVDVNPDGIGSGQRLIQTDATAIGPGAQIIPLTVSITNGQFSSVTFPFAINIPSEDNATLTLQAFLNGIALPTTATATATIPQNFDNYSTGLLTFTPGANNIFDSFTLTSSVPGFAIDDVSLTPSTPPVSGVPEPATTALLLFGMAGMLGFIRHRQQAAAKAPLLTR